VISAKDYLAQQQQESSQEYADNASKAEAYLATQKGEAFSESSALGDVYDGDTVYDDQGGQRILGGNTSEMKSADGSSQPLSIEAQERMKELLNSGEYTKRASGEKGYYGRDLTSYVNKDGETAMTQLIREGYAAPTSYGGNDASITAEGASINAQFDALNTFDRTGTTPALDAMRDYDIQAPVMESTWIDKRGFAERAFDRGTDMMQMNYHQFGELLGDMTGFDAMKEWGEEGVMRNMYEAALSPADVETTDDIDSLTDLGKYIVEKTLENAPNLLADIGVAAGTIAATVATGGAASAVLAPAMLASIGKSFVGKVGWKAAGKFGFTGSMYAQMTGESRNTQLAAGVDNPLLALGAGAVNTALEYRGLQSILKGFMPKGQITNAAGLAKHIGKQAGLSTGIEGSTEWLQGLTNELAIKMANPDHKVDWDMLTESFFAGMAAGGGMATVSSTVGGGTNYLRNKSRVENIDTNTVPETPESVQAQVDEVSSVETTRDTAIFPDKESIKDTNIPEELIVGEAADGSVIVTSNQEKADIHKEQGMAAAKELRGYQQSKQEMLESGKERSVVTRRDAAGNELSSEVVTTSNAPAAMARERAEAKPTDTVEITKEDQSQVLAERNSQLDRVDAQNQTTVDVERNLGNPTLLELPQTPEQEAPKVVNRQDLSPVPEGEQDTASLTNDKGELRRTVDLIKDLVTGKLSYEVVTAELKRLGVNTSTDISSTEVAMDREATISSLLDAGVTSPLLMRAKDDKRAKFNPYRNAKDILADASVTDMALQELAKANGVAPTVQDNFNEVKMIAKIVQQLTKSKAQIPDDVSQVAFLFNNPAKELVRDKEGSNPQTRLMFTLSLNVVDNPRDVLMQHLLVQDISNSDTKDQTDNNARKLEIARIGSVLGVKVSAKERMPGSLSNSKKNVALARIQQLVDVYDGPQEKSTQQTMASNEQQMLEPVTQWNRAKERAEAKKAGQKAAKDELAKKAAIAKRRAAKKKKQNENAKVDVTQDLAKQLEAGMKNLPVDQVEQDESDNAVNSDQYVSDDTRGMIEEFRAKAFDLAVVRAIWKELGLPEPDYMKLKEWEPVSQKLQADGIRERVIRESHTPASKDHVRRLLKTKAQRTGLMDRLRKETTDEGRLRIILNKNSKTMGLIERPTYEYDAALLDGEREQALWEVNEGEGARPVNPGVSVPEDSPEQASVKSFFNRLGGLEVHNDTTLSMDQLIDDLLDYTPSPMSERIVNGIKVLSVDAPVGDQALATPSSPAAPKFKFGRIFKGRKNVIGFSDENSGPALRNTMAAKGKNLLKAYAQSENWSGDLFLDAIRLTQMGLGKKAGSDSRANHTMGDLLRGFYTALDRMSVGPEVDGVEVRRLYKANDVTDDLVIHIDNEGKAVTLGEAKRADHKLNPDNPSWMRGIDREDIQDEVDLLNKDLGKTYRRLRAKLKLEPNNSELKHAVSYMEGQMERFTDRDGMDRASANPAGDNIAYEPNRKESKNEALERTQAERKAIRKLAPDVEATNDAIVQVWNRARTAVYDNTMGMDQDKPQDVDSPDNIDRVQGRQGLVGDSEATDYQDPDYDEKNQEADPDSDKIDAYYGEGTEGAQSAKTEEKEFVESSTAPTTGRPRRDGTLGIPVTRGESKTKPVKAAAYKPKAKSTFLGKGLGKLTNEIQQLLDYVQSSKIGLKLPLVVIAESDLNAKSLPELDAKTINKLRRNMAKGHNGAFLSMGTYGIIVLRAPIAGSTNKNRANALAIMSHEIGHAVFESMSADYQGILEKAYKEQGNQGDGTQMREWVADQVAHYIAARGKTAMKGNANEFTKAIAKIADALVGLWRTATRALMENGVYIDFSYYFDSVISERDAAFRLNVPNTNLYNLTNKEAAQQLRTTGARAKQAIKGGWRPITKVVRSVYSRLSDYSKDLSAELYQKSQTKGVQAYEQLQRFLNNEMLGEFSKLERRIGDKDLKQAFVDLRAGNLNANARALRRAIDSTNKLLKAYVPTMHFRENFIPEAFDHEAIEKNRAVFEKMLVDAGIVSSADVGPMVQDLLYSQGVTDFSLAPGKAVSTHQSVNQILAAISPQKLMEAGFLLDNPHAIMSHYIGTSAKRVAWEFKFGGYTDKYKGDARTIRYRLLTQAGYDVSSMGAKQAETLVLETGLEKDGKFYSPNHRIQQYMEQVRTDYGESGVKEVKELLDSALGRAGNDIPSSLRTSFDWITTWMNLTLLAFSGVASLPELAGSVVRARGQLSASDFFDVIKDLPQMKQFALDVGLILTDGASQMALETMGAQYSSPLQHKVSQVFFKINGQDFITKLSRTLALSTGKRFLVNAAERVNSGDKAAVDELAMIQTDAAKVNQWVKDGMPSDNHEINKALTQFVYEASIMPSKFEATKWGNNPYWKLAWHLKQFFYSYGTIIVGGIARHTYQNYQQAVKNGTAPPAAALMASTPLLIAGLVFMPLAGLSEELRELIKGTNRTDRMRGGEYAKHLLSKTGGLGPFEMLGSMHQAYEWNNSVVASMTPITGFAETMLSSSVSGDKKLQRLIPFYSQKAFGGLYE
jgi:endonuclease YncB( thermonuclease family)